MTTEIDAIENDLREAQKCVSNKTPKARLTATATATGLFALISSPWMYDGLQSIFGQAGITLVSGGVPTPFGLITTAVIYTLATRAAMSMLGGKSCKRHDANGILPPPNGGNDPATGGIGSSADAKPKNSKDLWVASAMGGFLYLVVSSPYLYQLTNQLTSALGLKTSSAGRPNGWGLGLHSLVFGGAVYVAMK
jgi:hypothetical protein